MALLNLPVGQLLDGNGDPISGGTVTVYLAGTATLASLYANSTYTTASPNPVTADSAGRYAVPYLPGGVYKVVIKDAGGATLVTHDRLEVNDLYASKGVLRDEEGQVQAFHFGAQQAKHILANFTDALDLPQWGAVADLVAAFEDSVFPAVEFGDKLSSSHSDINFEFWDPDYSTTNKCAMYADANGVIQFRTAEDDGNDINTSFRIDARTDLTLASPQSGVTREKGDNRYVRQDPGTSNYQTTFRNDGIQTRLMHPTFSTTDTGAVYMDADGYLQLRTGVDDANSINTSARVDDRSTTALATAQSIVTREKGDARYVRRTEIVGTGQIANVDEETPDLTANAETINSMLVALRAAGVIAS